MKKLALLLGAALIMGATTYACDGHKEKGKKEACCSKDKKETAAKGCCKKGEGKTTTANDAKKAPTKEAKTTPTAKKS